MEFTRPFFSIVIPCYNRASMVLLAVRSVLAQTFTSFELIIVDDGGTDNTREVVEGFEDSRIRYFYKTNEERSIARNYGISKAVGAYINFLDSDDFFYPHHLQTAYDFLQTHASPIFHSGFEIRDDNNVLIQTTNIFEDSTARDLINDNSLICNAIFIREDIAKKHRFLSDKRAVIAEDWYLWLVLASRFRIDFGNTVTCVVREHGSRSLNSLSPVRVIDSFNVVFKALENDFVFLEFYGRKAYAMFKAKNLCFAALIFVVNSNKRKAFELLSLAVKTDFRIIVKRRFLTVLKKIIVK